MAQSKYITILLVLAAFLLAGCKTTKVTTKTEVDTHTETATDSASVAVHSDSTGLDMSKQLSIIDKLKGNVEIDEVIETITTAATDSTPATTTTKTTRHIKATTEQEQETNLVQDTHITSVSQDSISGDSHTNKKEQSHENTKVTEKERFKPPIWVFIVIVILFIVWRFSLWAKR